MATKGELIWYVGGASAGVFAAGFVTPMYQKLAPEALLIIGALGFAVTCVFQYRRSPSTADQEVTDADS